MACLSAVSGCYVCKDLFSYNPDKVPAWKGNPICSDCIVAINELRVEKGNEPVPVHPDAYEPVEDA